MKKTLSALLLVFVILFNACPLPSAWAGEEPVAKVAGVNGTLLTLRAAAPKGGWQPATVNTPDYLEDRLKTDASSVAAVQFVVGGYVGLDKSTEIQLTGERAAKQVGQNGLRTLVVNAGAVWAKFSKQSQELHIQTQGGVLGLEGTEFVVEEDPGRSTKVSVLEGQVAMTTPTQVYHVKAGEQLTVPFQDVPVVTNPGAEALRREQADRHPDLYNNMVVRVVYTAMGFVVPGIMPYANLGLAIVTDPKEAAKEAAAQAAEQVVPQGWILGGVIRNINTQKKIDFIVGLAPDQEQVATATPTFYWEDFEGADSYWFALGDTVGPNGEMAACLYKQQVKETTLPWPSNGPRLEGGKTYYWRVIAVNADGKPASKWSQTFLSIDQNAANVLSTNRGVPPGGPAAGAPAPPASGASAPSQQQGASPAPAGTTPASASPASSSAPAAAEPVGHITGAPPAAGVLFRWQAPAGAAGFTLVISTHQDLSAPLYVTSTPPVQAAVTAVTIPSQNFRPAAGVTYYWRVESLGPQGGTLASGPISSFTFSK